MIKLVAIPAQNDKVFEKDSRTEEHSSHVIPGMGDHTARAMEDTLEEDPSEEKGEEDVSER